MQLQSLPDGAVAWALDRIKSSPEVSPLVARLLDNVVLASNLSSAFEIKRSAPDLAVVTMSGEYISRDGVVFAGFNADNGNSILQRKIQIRQLENESAGNPLDRPGSWRKQKNSCSHRWASQQQTVREKRDASQRMQVNASTLQGQLSLLDRELREAEGKVKSLNWERDNVRQRLDAATGKVNSIEDELANSNRDLERLQTELATAITEVNSLRRDEETLADLVNELRVRVATERQRKENLQRQRLPMAVRMAELKDLIVDRQRDIANYSARIEQYAKETATLRASIEQLQMEQIGSRSGGRPPAERSSAASRGP